MNVKVMMLLACIFGVCLLYIIMHKWILPPITSGAHYGRVATVDTDSHNKLSKPATSISEGLHTHQSAITHETDESEGEDKSDNQKRDDYSHQREGITKEDFVSKLDDTMRQYGIEPPHRPYLSRLKEIYKMVEARGYKRDELSDYFVQTMKRTAPALFQIELPGDERKHFDESLEKSKTMQLVKLFENQDRAAIEKWMNDRLSKNEYDIPALYTKRILNTSVFTIDKLLDTVEEIINALDHLESNNVSKEAILYFTLGPATTWGEMTEDGIESLKQSSSPDKIPELSHWLLFDLELAGVW